VYVSYFISHVLRKYVDTGIQPMSTKTKHQVTCQSLYSTKLTVYKTVNQAARHNV